jgi:hypothetical protein
VRLIFERGVELSRSDQGVWLFASAERRLTGTLASVASKYALRPVLGFLNTSSGPLLFRADKAGMLDLEHSELYQMFLRLRDAAILSFRLSLLHVLGAVMHHCKRLAEEYSRVCRGFGSPGTSARVVRP